MIRDFRTGDDRSVFEADICVIGAGAAGITLGLEFADSSHKVLILESGGLEPDVESQSLYEGAIAGEPYPELDTARLRFFGGTTGHWGGHCCPFDPIDFEARPWVPYSGWPVTRADLDPFYERAHPICELGPYEYRPEAWREGAPDLIQFQTDKLIDRIWQSSPPTRFGERYRENLKRAKNVDVLLHANVVDIVLNDSAKAVEDIKIKSLDGKSGSVRAKHVVLACGGIENPRLLLASNKVMKTGIGNEHDLVGRFFLEHPHALIAFGVPLQPIRRFDPYTAFVDASIPAGKAVIQAKPGLSPELQRRERLLNTCVGLGVGYDRSDGYLAFRYIAKKVANGELPDDFGAAMMRVARDIGGLAGGLYNKLSHTDFLWFDATAEQAPNPDSRVMLSDACDALGMRKLKLDWRLSEIDKRTARYTCRVVGEELARLNLARLRLDPWLLADDSNWVDIGARYHHMGTTRMSDDPKQGVVDRNARVHGVGNLYIAGSSIFPTSGYANPTLTIVAMAIRLAEHLKNGGQA